MHEMSKLEFLFNNPEWVAVFASAVFAVFTIIVIIWQVFVMKAQVRVMLWQGRTSARHESKQNRLIESQNKLIRFQFEHQRMQILNGERAQLLKLGRELHLAVASVVSEAGRGLEIRYWGDVLDAARELDSRLNVLDVAAFSGEYDHWFPALRDYVGAILNIVIEKPSPETVKKLEDKDKHLNPIGIFLDIETAIRMDFFDFKKKWDAETSNV
jgi:hypothetical protein